MDKNQQTNRNEPITQMEPLLIAEGAMIMMKEGI